MGLDEHTLWHLVMSFFTGALLCNSVPHVIAGVRGRHFPTPFARPRGAGKSSPSINLLWGFGNAMLGVWLCYRQVHSGIGDARVAIVAAVGFVLFGLWLAQHFSKREKMPT